MSLLDIPSQAPPNSDSVVSPDTDPSRRAGSVEADVGRIRPAGLARGSLAFVAAWAVGLAIARLTGAAAVVLLLVATVVAFLGAALAGWWRLRRLTITDLTTGSVTVVGDTLTVSVTSLDPSLSRSPVDVDILGSSCRLDPSGSTLVEVEIAVAGIVEHVDMSIRSSGAPGLVSWRRPIRLVVDPLYVAPLPDGANLPVDRRSASEPGEAAGGHGPHIGDLDGTRPWRSGEGQQSIHWPSSLRSGELIAYDRITSTEVCWLLSLDTDAARLRRTMEDGIRHGHEVVLEVDPQSGRTEAVRHRGDVLRWSAIAAERQRVREPERSRSAVWKRQLSWPSPPETDPSLSTRTRLLTALAAVLALNMLSGTLDEALLSRLAITIGVGVATSLSLWARTGRRTTWLRAVAAIVALAALLRIGLQSSGVGGLLEALRGPLPDLLLLLVVLHGAEVVDRRTGRVHLAITGVVVAYAAGLRIDGDVGWWLLAWGVVAIAATATSEPRRVCAHPVIGWSVIGPVLGWAVIGFAATVGLAAFVPIPDGPASLGLPSLSPEDAIVDSSGVLLGADGSPASASNSPTRDSPTRGALGQAGGYPGFSETLDTAVRGDLGDEIVMRVRAPDPAFWRGQIFTEFDGRTWRVTPERGDRVQGPQIRVPPTIGDRPAPGTPTEEFVQTFTVESDLPNVIFAAGRPDTVIFDGSVVTRSDGALRADRTLVDGTVYSVVSQRVDVTADTLRRQGDLGRRFAPFRGDADLQRFLTIPDSTSAATVDLANDLRVSGSTYDTIIAYQDWMALNTRYDLDAPVPDGDAVDDFLFHSQRGFCEQIASSLVVMLRSQGVPTRLATGFIPGTRDRISGVFEVRASDAHAWVEVWFPETGWEAFDPTAEVPLAGDADRSTVGADAAGAIIDGVLSRPFDVVAVIALLGGIFSAIRGAAELRRRRRRGRWGLLHDRFMSLAPGALTAPAAASQLMTALGLMDVAGSHRPEPHEVAGSLDRVAFDPDHTPTTDDHRRISAAITSLERQLRRR